MGGVRFLIKLFRKGNFLVIDGVQLVEHVIIITPYLVLSPCDVVMGELYKYQQ